MKNLPQVPVVIAEGSDWFAINKPTGLSVHNEKGNDVVSSFPEHENLFLLNRLDAKVSGIVLLATNKSVASAIQAQFADRSVEKRYRAIGLIGDGFSIEVPCEGLWKKPLTKKAENRNKPAGFGGKRVPCQTTWRAERVDGDRLYLTLSPHTGRKHQLRRHAAIAGWPLLGDQRYGSEDDTNDFGGRIALHSDMLVFRDPNTNENVEVECPAPW